MKYLVLALCFHANATTRPAQGILCTATDADFKFEMIINEFNGDLYPGTFILSEAGKQVPAEVKQYSNYRGSITMAVSTGPQGDNDDTGYIIDLSKSYNGGYYGNAEKYVANPPGKRDEQDATYMRLECQSKSP